MSNGKHATRPQQRVERAWRAYGTAVVAQLRAHGWQQVPDGPGLVDARDALCTALDATGGVWADLRVIPRARRRPAVTSD